MSSLGLLSANPMEFILQIWDQQPEYLDSKVNIPSQVKRSDFRTTFQETRLVMKRCIKILQLESIKRHWSGSNLILGSSRSAMLAFFDIATAFAYVKPGDTRSKMLPLLAKVYRVSLSAYMKGKLNLLPKQASSSLSRVDSKSRMVYFHITYSWGIPM